MQEANQKLQASITKSNNELLTAKQRVTELESKKPSNTGYVITIVVLIILAILGFIL